MERGRERRREGRKLKGKERRFLHKRSGFERGKNLSEMIDAEQPDALEGRRVLVGARDAQQLVSSVRLTESEGADHAAGSVASDLVRWCSGWWWEQPKQHSGQSQVPISVQPICDRVELGLSERGKDAGLEEVSKTSHLSAGAVGGVSDRHHLGTGVA
jgi:hypothetical protein